MATEQILNTNTPMLDSLKSQADLLISEIATHEANIVPFETSRKAWHNESARLYTEWENVANNMFKQAKAAELKVAFEHAKSRVDYYQSLILEQRNLRNAKINQLNIVQKAISDYYSSVNQNIANGIPEGGSVAIAEAEAAAITARMSAELAAEKDEKTKKTTRNIILFVGIALVAFLIWKSVIKRKK